MSDQQQDHWRELANLLGVAPEASAGAAAQAGAPVREESSPETRTLEPSAPPPSPPIIEHRRVQPVVEEKDFDPSLSFRRPEAQQAVVETAPPPAAAVADEAVAEETAPPESEEPRGEEAEPWERAERGDRERGGQRRRGGRGREERRDREGRGESPNATRHREEAPPRPAEREELEDEEESAEGPEEEEIEEPEAAPVPEDDEIDEEDTLTDWNVPSWQELIASLYRPER